jgi:predicted NodU family carbamoyl transferase
MNVIGFHGGLKREDDDQRQGFSFHDAAAVLIHDAAIVAAIEEERLSRQKHSNAFPRRAIRYCLDQGGISLGDVDCFATNVGETFRDRSAQAAWLADASATAKCGRELAAEAFARIVDVDILIEALFLPTSPRTCVECVHAVWLRSQPRVRRRR